MNKASLVLCVVLLSAVIANGQGFIYDQQSGTIGTGGGGTFIQEHQPVGQSFTPTLSSIEFVQLELTDGHPGNSLGASVFVNLWSGSISNGTLLSSTDPIFMPDSFFDITNFFFPTPVSLTPGTVYYLQPFVQSGDTWTVIGATYNYTGGTMIFQGNANANVDLFFSEGIVAVPEPSSAMIIMLGSGLFLYTRHKRIKRSPF